MPGDLFSDFCKVCESIRATTKKTAKVEILSRYFVALSKDVLPMVSRFLSGHIFPKATGKEAFVGVSTLWSLVSEVTGVKGDDLAETYRKYGDLGSAAEELFGKKQVYPLFPRDLTVQEVDRIMERMASASGKGSSGLRRTLMKGLLLQASPFEAKYLVKIPTRVLRIGLEEGLVEESVAKAFGYDLEEVRDANLVVGDIGETVLLASTKMLGESVLQLMKPANFMLADTMQTAQEIAEYYDRPLYAEFKYDGVRTQIHKKGEATKLFSRRLADMSSSFPEIVDALKKMPYDMIFDGEILPFKDGRPLPFQFLQQRLHRKHFPPELASEVPVALFLYDLLYLDGKVLLKKTLKERRRLLSTLGLAPPLYLSHMKEVDAADEIQNLFDESRALGYEGLVLKTPDSAYMPGRRGRLWIKLKRELGTLDVVIVAAEYGHGKRAGVLSDYTFAVRDGDEFKVVGKAYSGLTDQEILEMTKRLKELAMEDQGFRLIVKPEVVLEVAFDNVQRSHRHNSGYALRFPRIKRIRDDKASTDIDTVEGVEEIYHGQKLR